MQAMKPLIPTKNVIRLSIAMMLLICSSATLAQNLDEDVIYLKNGSVIRGQIIEQKFGEYVKIESYGANVWVFDAEAIDRIVKAEAINLKKQGIIKETGYFNVSEAGVLGGKDDFGNKFSLSVLVTNGYKFKNKISAGVTTGLEVMEIASAPALADVRFDFSNKKFTPFIAAHAGYSFPLTNYYNATGNHVYQGGYSLGAAAGIKNYFTDNTALVFSIGFRQTQLISHESVWWWNGERQNIMTEQIFNRVSVHLGFLFN